MANELKVTLKVEYLSDTAKETLEIVDLTITQTVPGFIHGHEEINRQLAESLTVSAVAVAGALDEGIMFGQNEGPYPIELMEGGEDPGFLIPSTGIFYGRMAPTVYDPDAKTSTTTIYNSVLQWYVLYD